MPGSLFSLFPPSASCLYWFYFSFSVLALWTVVSETPPDRWSKQHLLIHLLKFCLLKQDLVSVVHLYFSHTLSFYYCIFDSLDTIAATTTIKKSFSYLALFHLFVSSKYLKLNLIQTRFFNACLDAPPWPLFPTFTLWSKYSLFFLNTLFFFLIFSSDPIQNEWLTETNPP